jgi:hypothetical protein
MSISDKQTSSLNSGTDLALVVFSRHWRIVTIEITSKLKEKPVV